MIKKFYALFIIDMDSGVTRTMIAGTDSPEIAEEWRKQCGDGEVTSPYRYCYRHLCVVESELSSERDLFSVYSDWLDR